jgi:hypothetical protein
MPPILREPHLAALTAKKRFSKKSLQLLELRTQRRGRNMDRLRGSRDSPIRRHSQKIAEMVVIELRIHDSEKSNSLSEV